VLIRVNTDKIKYKGYPQNEKEIKTNRLSEVSAAKPDLNKY
jgi:hypothetical protein